ncbi:putative aminopeptidase YhfE [Petrocella atlantisensis]|uniref:Putative aminopeptidase YhfE n=1 Tax=Petrocella atlantisensis TaxID=2173034 RepID=A0A3P7P260_9FIRM|nr:M42 family metallopeptidase [Petrocella atlantisensis]VDN47590.1 putative aminopeptidase YhfE [Petrocella atlantisensis]
MMDMKYIKHQLSTLVGIHSPSGFCDTITDYVKKEANRLGYTVNYTQKGGIYVTIEGFNDKEAIGMASHLDTLGAMVRSINDDGTIRFTSIGGYMMSTINGAYCSIYTREGKTYKGTVLSKKASVHVYEDIHDYKLIEENMLIRVDELVHSKEDILGLGIEVGNFIGVDPMYRETESGFINSRHLDNKAGAAILLGLLETIKSKKIVLKNTLQVIFTTYEEVGHGASYIPENIKTLIAVDMGAIGEDLSCTEQEVSICVKDSSGPYDHKLVSELLEIAKNKNIKYALDVYPHYGSDASAALKSGANIRAALIGPGIHASHGMERTHEKALEQTLLLLLGFLEKYRA